MVRRFVVSLPSDEYRRLRELADREERIVEQQATYLLRRALGSQSAASPPDDRVAVGAAAGERAT